MRLAIYTMTLICSVLNKELHNGRVLRDKWFMRRPASLDNVIIANDVEPLSYTGVMTLPDSSKWQCAVDEEMSWLVANSTWTLINKLSNRLNIDSKWDLQTIEESVWFETSSKMLKQNIHCISGETWAQTK